MLTVFLRLVVDCFLVLVRRRVILEILNCRRFGHQGQEFALA